MKAPASLPMAVVELWYQGLRASWLPRDYSVVAVEATPGVITLGIGFGDGSEVVAVERLHCSVTLSSDHPPIFGGPLEEVVRDAWIVLCSKAWSHHRAAVATKSASTVTEGGS